MTKLYEVEVPKLAGDKKFYVVEEDGNSIGFLFQSLEEAKLSITDHRSAYGLVMPQGEVISYGKSIGFIKDKVEIERIFKVNR
jgi:hypothetical protein